MTSILVVVALVLLGSSRPAPRPPLRKVGWYRGSPPDRLMLPRLLVVALSAGLPLAGALAEIARLVPGPAGKEADGFVRSARRAGLAAALAANGDVLDGLPTRLARAHLTGGTMQDAVRSHVREEADTIRADALAGARTLPVKLLIPISLLLLPGFIALVVVPPLIEEIGGILGPLPGP